jgi:SAM-dependent methyltransferase
MYKELEDAWTHDSGGYDELIKKQLMNHGLVTYWSRELQKVLDEEPLDILEVGCGPGFLSIILARLGHRVKAIDGSSGMVACAEKNFRAEGKNIPLEEEDAVMLPHEEKESFDVIISRDVVWTLYDPEHAFQRWKEVLRPGGKIVYYDGNYRRDRRLLKYTLWKGFSEALAVLIDRKLPQKKAHHEEGGEFAKLPLVTCERPEKDMELLREAGYKCIRITNDRYRNSPGNMEFWKYGYQGKKFRVIAWKKVNKNG